jgi:hypothetical protein
MEEKIKSGYFIMKISQIGNIGPYEIKKIKDQPKDGFPTEADAIRALEGLLKKKETFCYSWDQLTVLRLWEYAK